MKTVLVAYEREQDLAAVETLLATRGHRVLRARTGVEALDLARRDNPSMVLSDVMLPKLDGFALCRRLKEDPVLQRIPVVLHSFRVEGPKYEVFAAEVGAERFMPRGSRIEDLVNLIEDQQPGSGTMRLPVLVPELLEKREQDVGACRISSASSPSSNPRTSDSVARNAKRARRPKSRPRRHAPAPSRRVREASERMAADLTGVTELKTRVAELESQQRELAQSEANARSQVEETRGELARVNLLETRLAEAQSARHTRAGRGGRRRAPARRAAAANLALRHGDAGAARRERFGRCALRRLAGVAPQAKPARAVAWIRSGRRWRGRRRGHAAASQWRAGPARAQA
jgi:CheY-like chemotaxis protein